jgi:hypothetical protein
LLPSSGPVYWHNIVADALRDHRVAEEILGVNIEELDLAGRR